MHAWLAFSPEPRWVSVASQPRLCVLILVLRDRDGYSSKRILHLHKMDLNHFKILRLKISQSEFLIFFLKKVTDVFMYVLVCLYFSWVFRSFSLGVQNQDCRVRNFKCQFMIQRKTARMKIRSDIINERKGQIAKGSLFFGQFNRTGHCQVSSYRIKFAGSWRVHYQFLSFYFMP